MYGSALNLAAIGVWAFLAAGPSTATENDTTLGTSPASSSWQLDFNFHDPQRISVQLPGHERAATYWYVLFTVTNNTGQDAEFYPSFRLVTDTLQVVEGGANIDPRVYGAIAARHKKEYPFFAPPAKITGPLLQGEDNARTSAAVFRTFDPSANGFTIYVGGLSSEISRVPNPDFQDKTEESETNQRFFILRKTLAVTYKLPGDVLTQSRATPVRDKREWVMR
ncbi:MAG: hypothetical protein JSV78_12620 [Phycisphaerales bacterium]|nr:MAG: hypothetical protein JSV78_12620 [Phycisphaerales bacterium]